MSASERKAVQDAVASLERTLGIEGQYEAGLIASAARIRQADDEIVRLRAEVARLRAALVAARDGLSRAAESLSLVSGFDFVCRRNYAASAATAAACAIALEPTR